VQSALQILARVASRSHGASVSSYQNGPPGSYAKWMTELKTRIHTAQQRAALAVNRELALLYWQIGSDILHRRVKQGRGAQAIKRLGQDLRTAFPDIKGRSAERALSF